MTGDVVAAVGEAYALSAGDGDSVDGAAEFRPGEHISHGGSNSGGVHDDFEAATLVALGEAPDAFYNFGIGCAERDSSRWVTRMRVTVRSR